MNRALLVIDVQYEYFTGRMPVTYPEGSFGNILKAVDTANAQHIPVVLIQHTAPQPTAKTFVASTNGWEVHADLLGRPHACVIEKSMPGSFTNTGLLDFLQQHQVDTVVICGYMTQMCCDTTARQASHLGFSVEFLSDATGTLAISNSAGQVTAEELHRAILVTQAMRFAQVLSTEAWMERLSV